MTNWFKVRGRIIALVIILIAFFLSVACSDGGNPVTGPSATTTPAASTPPTPPNNVPNPPPDSGGGNNATTCADKSVVTVTWLRDEKATFKNTSATCEADVILASFFAPDPFPRFETQKIEEYVGAHILPGGVVTLTVRLPKHETCGVTWWYQVDALFGITEAQVKKDSNALNPPHKEANLISFKMDEVRNAPCAIPPPPPPVPTCEGVITTLMQGAEQLLPATLKTSITPVLSGTGAIGVLTIDGAARSFTSGATIPLEFERPLAGQPDKVVVVTFFSKVGDATCATRTISIRVKAREPIPESCGSLELDWNVFQLEAVGSKMLMKISLKWVGGNNLARVNFGEGYPASDKNYSRGSAPVEWEYPRKETSYTREIAGRATFGETGVCEIGRVITIPARPESQ
ncbi:hypothetical protein HZA26_00500 [Candidatus Nomurabacteria bacterium]|nr:hypothetical protein [Candidatus Nomurabacteria bacterium]